jgi:hypothetical protein
MNLITKLRNFMRLRAKGVSLREAYKASFKYPLTDGDIYALTITACIVLICIALHFKRDIDDEMTLALERQAIATEEMQEYAKMAQHIEREKQHIERVLVSALNGAVIENGRKVTMCRLSAAGECK